MHVSCCNSPKHEDDDPKVIAAGRRSGLANLMSNA
jgi:hypothetical protein